MSKTTITDANGGVTTIRKTSGCGGCGWTILILFLLFAPGAWATNGSIPIGVAVAMYLVLGVVLLAGLAQWRSRAQ